ncbi:MAG: hypothetical protein HRT61_03920 [Ekhidna sp.]|nr:hypothetical protein [Ekhidna sp.]
MKTEKRACLKTQKVAPMALTIKDQFRLMMYLDGACHQFKLDPEEVLKEMVRQKINNQHLN